MTVRVRIAPSPTGDPHVGTAYIGLLNYCFAKAHGGQFVLRIEDTDRKRSNPESLQMIIDSMHWLGLDYDEGPDKGGDHGPYIQSERQAQGIYQRYAEQLIEQGDAYYCFATEAELAEMREAQKAAGGPMMYDRRYRDLDPAEAASRVAAGEAHVVRMKAPLEGEHSYKDRLRKQPTVKQWADIDDQVLLKNDGWPTYHLAAVVDDHLMGITHVIRAEEWLNSLPKHTWLGERLGFAIPEYIHVGLLRNPDKSKLSKRKNPTNILWYRQQGYLPEALLNFLCLLGHSHPDEREQFDLQEMIRIFDMNRFDVSGPVFDTQKLNHIQGLYLRDLSDDGLKAAIHDAIDQRLDELLPMLRPRMTFGGDITFLADFIFAGEVKPSQADLVPKGWDAAQTKQALQALLSTFNKANKKGKLSWTADGIESLTRKLGDDKEWKPKQFFMALRVAIVGRRESPQLFDSMVAVGQNKCLKRLDAAIKLLR